MADGGVALDRGARGHEIADVPACGAVGDSEVLGELGRGDGPPLAAEPLDDLEREATRKGDVARASELKYSTLPELEKQLQDEALLLVGNAVRRSRAGLGDPHRPIGSFLFMGWGASSPRPSAGVPTP